MISLLDYIGPHAESPDWTEERKANAEALLDKVNACLIQAEAFGVEFTINPDTETFVSGKTFGGFRPQDCPQGSPDSSHKQGRGIDVFDPRGELDSYLTDKILESHGLFRESPSATRGWTHLSDRSPPSKRRTFMP